MIIQGIAIALLVLTQVLDWHSTMAFLKAGTGVEGNQLLRDLFEKYGASKVMILKGLLHMLLIPVILWMPPIACIGLAPFLLYYAKIIKNNYKLASGR